MLLLQLAQSYPNCMVDAGVTNAAMSNIANLQFEYMHPPPITWLSVCKDL